MTTTPTGSAAILPFPARPLSPALRLQRALAGLEAALDEQRAAVARFRAELAALGGATQGLQASLAAYRGELAGLAREVAVLGTRSEQLRQHCDRALTQAATPGLA